MNKILIEELSSTSNQTIQTQEESEPLIKTIAGRKGKCIVCKKLCYYSCPKCRKKYCGVQHFRSHNLYCSEEFYEKQITESLKGLKVTDKAQKKKAAEMVKKHQLEMEEENFTFDLTVERLEEILAEIESGQEPKLGAKEQYLFDKYLNSLEGVEIGEENGEGETKESVQVEIEKPYWEISDGMSIYLLQNVEIEEFGESEHPEIIGERHLFKQRLDEFALNHPYTESVIKPVINLHVVQILYEFLLLFRVFDGECSEFAQILLEAYCTKQNETILKTEEVTIEIVFSTINKGLIDAYENVNGIQGENVLKIWMKDYIEIVWADLIKVLENKHLILETLLRIVDCVNETFRLRKNPQGEEVLEQINKVNEEEKAKSKLSEKEKKHQIMLLRMTKKCEYLIYFIYYKYNTKALEKISFNIKDLQRFETEQKEEKDVERFKIQKLV